MSDTSTPMTLGPTLLYLCNGQPVGIQDYRAIMYAYKVKTQDRNRDLTAKSPIQLSYPSTGSNALMGETSVNAPGAVPSV